jgi:hypothetical protein
LNKRDVETPSIVRDQHVVPTYILFELVQIVSLNIVKYRTSIIHRYSSNGILLSCSTGSLNVQISRCVPKVSKKAPLEVYREGFGKVIRITFGKMALGFFDSSLQEMVVLTGRFQKTILHYVIPAKDALRPQLVLGFGSDTRYMTKCVSEHFLSFHTYFVAS